MDVPTPTTTRLALEPLATSHSLGMFALWSDPDVCRYSGKLTDRTGNVVPSPVRSRGDSDKVLDFWRQASDDGWGFRWALVRRASGEFVGTAGFNSLAARSEYAYHLHPDHWRKGLMSEASAAAFAWIAGEGFCTELEAVIAADNARSIAFAQRWRLSRTDELPGDIARYRGTLDRVIGAAAI